MAIKGAKDDAGKVPVHKVPTGITWAIGKVRAYGFKKYGAAEDWKSIEPERWLGAAFRHMLRVIEDPESVDPESGLPHLWHLAANIAFLIERIAPAEGKAPEAAEPEEEKAEIKCGGCRHFDPDFPQAGVGECVLNGEDRRITDNGCGRWERRG